MESILGSEFEGVVLGDARLERRAQAAMEALARQPAAGVTTTLSSAELEGYYRFINNEKVTLAALLAAHIGATRARIDGRSRVVIAHDTTDFRFTDETAREGLGPMDNGGQGFYAHFSLAVGEARRAFGVVGVEAWTRQSRTSPKLTREQRYCSPTKETLRWMRAVEVAERAIGDECRLIHVMDREADDYDILRELVTGDRGFVVRASYDRRLAIGRGCLKSFCRELEVRCERDANLSYRRKSRPAKQRRAFPPRDARTATLSFAAGEVTLRRPDKSRASEAELTLNVIHVQESSPPDGCAPLEWTLLTREPIDTPEQIFQIVDDYRARWVIEEYFKALKTGCAFEKRQHETKDALLNALGLFIPIAWSLLNMRTLSRDEESSRRPAHEVLTATQLRILSLKAKGKLSEHATVGEAILIMARLLGGLQPSNGLPGWHILGKAFERLLELEAGWHMAMAAMESGRSDR